MSTWDYTAYAGYDSSGNFDGSNAISSGQLTDSDPTDDTFSGGELITGVVNFGVTSGTYIGTVEYLGVTWVGIDQGNFTIFYASPPDGTTAADVNEAFPDSFAALPLENTTGVMTCFAIGTLIATPDGERRVDTLAIGDDVMTADGRSVPVKWIGRQTVHQRFTPSEQFRPVRISAGALADNVPHTDLVVTADHGMVLDGIIANAGALVNGVSIVRVPVRELAESVTYYHIETDDHEVILAHGAPAETFVDNVTRARFDNHDEFLALYGAASGEMAEQALPRAMSRRQLPDLVRAALDERAETLAGRQVSQAA